MVCIVLSKLLVMQSFKLACIIIRYEPYSWTTLLARPCLWLLIKVIRQSPSLTQFGGEGGKIKFDQLKGVVVDSDMSMISITIVFFSSVNFLRLNYISSAVNIIFPIDF